MSEARDTRGIRFLALVETGPIDECWPWRGHIGQNGYPYFGAVPAYRVAYELLVGPIPTGLTLDHLCRNPTCVNPGHLEAVTMRVNVLRGEGPTAVHAKKTHCQNGHPFSVANTYRPKRGGRQCRTCRRNAEARRRRLQTPS